MRLRLVVWVSVGLLAAVVGGLTAFHAYRLRFDRGPYAQSLRSSTLVVTALPVSVGTSVVLGGPPVVDKAQVPWYLVKVEPANLPKGLQLERATAMHVGPGLTLGMFLMGPLSWLQTHPHVHAPLTSVPTKPGTLAEEPAVIVRPTRAGRYVVQGLLVTYQWGNQRYTTYVRQGFVVCAYRTNHEVKSRGCSSTITPPPLVWP